jgi:hypothetical protein
MIDRPLPPPRDGTKRRLPAAVGLLLLAVLPLAAVPPITAMRTATGPYWLRPNIDPTYAYLLNSLLIASGKGAQHSDHPGTTVQLVGAATIRVVHAVSGEAALPDDVLRRPEAYLSAMHQVLVAIFAATLLLAGAAIARSTGSLTAALLFQLTPFLGVRPFLDLRLVKAEPLLIPLVLAFGAVLVIETLAPAAPSARARVIVLGMLAGAAMATKVTVAPLLVLPFALVRSWRQRLLYAAIAAGTFAAITIPAMASPGRLFRFLFKFATHTGAYGSGDAGFITVDLFAERSARLSLSLVTSEWAFVALLGLSLVLVVVPLLRRRLPPAGTAERGAWRLLALLVAVQVASVLMVTKSPVVPLRYLVPAFGMLGVEAVLGWELLRWSGVLTGRRRSLAAAAVLVLGAAALLVSGLTAARGDLVRTRERALRAQEQAIEAASARGCRVAHGTLSSSPERALFFANGFAGGAFAAALDRVYPGALLYHARKRSLDSFSRSLSANEALAGGAVCAIAWKPGEPWPDGLEAEPAGAGVATPLRLAGQAGVKSDR